MIYCRSLSALRETVKKLPNQEFRVVCAECNKIQGSMAPLVVVKDKLFCLADAFRLAKKADLSLTQDDFKNGLVSRPDRYLLRLFSCSTAKAAASARY